MKKREIWRPHFKFGGYEASNLGRVKSVYRNGKERILKLRENEKGYLKFEVRHNGKRVTYRAHRFIYECFSGEFLGKREINHKDLDKKNNSIGNLEICSRSENMRHAWMGRKRGVTKATKSRNWGAQINISGNVKYLGAFPTKDEAYAEYYDSYLRHYGVAPW